MTTPYNQGVSRVGPGYDVSGTGDALVPEPLATSIIQELPKQSAALALCKKTILSTKPERLPVLDVLPQAYWVGGDTGLKQTSREQWKNVVMVVEELATIVPIPQAYLDDADIPIWDEVQPRMVEAAGSLIDQAVLWDINRPSTWGTSVYGGAVNAGNIVQQGFTNFGGAATTAALDFGQSVTALGDGLAQTGYELNGFAARPGLGWMLQGLRAAGSGVPIYSSQVDASIAGGNPHMASLYGYPCSMVNNGSWQSGQAQLLAGDFSKAIIGVRQDISFKMFTEGVISDNNGVVVLNLMQQDAVAMRMVMRLAYATVNPVTIMQPGKGITTRWPFGAVATTGSFIATGYPRTDASSGTTTGSAVVTDTHAVATDIGRPVSGPGIPAGAVVLSSQVGASLTISALATATASVSVVVGATYGALEHERESVELSPATTPKTTTKTTTKKPAAE
jgi:HK97 family phage major capsid protein